LSSLVPRAHIPSAVAMNSLQFNLSRTLGPAVAGLLLGRGGTGLCFAANALSFVAVILALARLEVAPPAGPRPAESLGASLRAGFRHVRRHPLLSRLTLLAATASFLAFPLITYLPVVASESLGAGAGGFSLLISCYGGGAILGALGTAQRGPASGRGGMLVAGFVAYGLAVTGAVFSGRLEAALVLLFAAGFSLVTAFSTVNSLVQEHATDEFRGRVQGIYGLAFRGGSPFGSLLAGGLVGRLGAPAVLAGYSAVLALVALGASRSRHLRAL
jgi:predicted MFS family arabinose efflux permease